MASDSKKSNLSAEVQFCQVKECDVSYCKGDVPCDSVDTLNISAVKTSDSDGSICSLWVILNPIYGKMMSLCLQVLSFDLLWFYFILFYFALVVLLFAFSLQSVIWSLLSHWFIFISVLFLYFCDCWFWIFITYFL